MSRAPETTPVPRATLRRVVRSLSDVVAYCWATGNWWVPAVGLVFAVAVVVVTILKLAVPTAVYVFF